MEAPVYATNETQHQTASEDLSELPSGQLQVVPQPEQRYTSKGLPIGPCGLVEGRPYWNLRNHSGAFAAHVVVGLTTDCRN